MAMTDWISVKDRLPEAWQTVLLWDGSEMVSGYADDDGDLIEHRWGLVFRATHWMLPVPPGAKRKQTCKHNCTVDYVCLACGMSFREGKPVLDSGERREARHEE